MANYIIAMNGSRVEPLENRYQLESGLEKYRIVASPNFPVYGAGDVIAEEIVWQNEEWPRSKQHEYLLGFSMYRTMANEARHLSVDGYFSFIIAGETAQESGVRAAQYFRNK